MNNQSGIAIIGCGYWGINYVRVFNELSQTQVVAACDQNPERLQEVGRRFPGVALTTDVAEVLSRDDIDAVVVATPATTHYEVAHACLTAGKHVLVEKPITIKAANAKDLVNLAEAKGLTLMVGHVFLYNAGVRKVKDCLNQDEGTRVYYLYSRRTNLGPIRHDVNALWDLAPHDVSIFNYLLDSTPSWVSAIGSKVLRNHREDVGFISLGYQDSVVGHIHVSWADPNKVREVVVVSNDMRIVFDDVKNIEQVRIFEKGIASEEIEAPSYGEFRFRIHDGDIISPRIEASEPLKSQCLHFIECFTQNKHPLTDGQSGLEVVQVMEAIDRSLAQNGAPVQVR
ncbi:MAG: Gfo/Idh/MocA family oxidoreductase [Anaerolineales bacterium]|nr:MAG: Gfo/Idh/MocA family oxidoreductase [Anaerolineales bacterium]